MFRVYRSIYSRFRSVSNVENNNERSNNGQCEDWSEGWMPVTAQLDCELLLLTFKSFLMYKDRCSCLVESSIKLLLPLLPFIKLFS